MKDDKREDRKHRPFAGGPIVQTSHYSGPPFTLADLVEAQKLKAQPLAPPEVCFDEDLKPLGMYDGGKLLTQAKQLHADMIQRVAEDDQDINQIDAAFEVLYKFLGGDR